MKLFLLGSGTPILDKQRQSTTAILIDIGAEKILFDTGRGVTAQMLKQDLHPSSIGTIFITHHHYDHICDLGEFLLSSWHNGRTDPIFIFGPNGTSHIVNSLLNQVYSRDIAFALFNEADVTNIREIVKVKDVTPGLVLQNDSFSLFAEYVDHGNSLGLSESEWPCFGYRLESDSKIITIGGDTIDCDGLQRLAKGADILVMSCYLADEEIQSPAFEKLANHIIASSRQVGKIAKRAGARKLLLTHFRKKSDELMTSLQEDVRADFDGEILIGEDGMVVDIK
jgi:ribonuclease BN (tRNA processing enzyme)